MAKVTFKLSGAAELRRRMREFGPRFVNNTSGAALRAGSRPVLDIARAKVPTVTWELHDSITSALRRAKFGERTIEMGFKPPTSRRAHLTEYGTAHSMAKPFMRPALDLGGAPAFAEILRVMRERIDLEALRAGPGAGIDDSDPEG